ncbi:hypothetical protein T484DRAFT_1631210 [Baffinella frigidus]|nr:hypothetical protein T484DRAFT_1631210 [Cryptophyta sp. CCMP2293]
MAGGVWLRVLGEAFPKPETPNHAATIPKPQTINDQRSTINDQRSTINHKPSTINHQPSTINHQPSTINHQLSTINHKALVVREARVEQLAISSSALLYKSGCTTAF